MKITARQFTVHAASGGNFLTRLRMNASADMAELADALDLGSSGAPRAGSSPVIRIKPRYRGMRAARRDWGGSFFGAPGMGVIESVLQCCFR